MFMALPKINRNERAAELTLMEGKKVEISIAQMKEAMKLYNTSQTLEEVIALWFLYNK